MKNMKVKTKLIVAFLIVAIIAAISGGFGIVGLSTLNNNEAGMYKQGIISVDATSLWRNVQEQRSSYRGAALKYYMGVDYESDITALDRLDAEFSQMMESLKEAITLPENLERLGVTEEAYAQFEIDRTNFVNAIQIKDEEAFLDSFNKMVPSIDKMTENLQQVSETATGVMDTTNTTDNGTAKLLIAVMAGLVALAVASAVFFAFYISMLISKPLITLTAFMNKAGKTGDLKLSQEDVENIGGFAKVKDEIGQCIGSTANFVEHLNVIGDKLQTVSNGDLTVDIELLSENDTMGVSLKKVVDSLNSMFTEIHTASAQVSAGSKQIADGSQTLAQGSTEQASAIEQLSASISEIKEKTSENADVAREASDLSGTIRSSAERGSAQMEQMMQAVKEINDASGQISKVIKVIDDIAFQTNILALNAAVEAARAGQHGKGFAVVAEEVRNLAAKSADAAKDTGGLIENSIEKANFGLSIATETSDSLKEIVEGIVRSAEIVSQIAKASDEQAAAIGQINTGIDQVAQVVQQNSATAEESAAASQEMSGQSNMLEELIAQFKLKDSMEQRF